MGNYRAGHLHMSETSIRSLSVSPDWVIARNHEDRKSSPQIQPGFKPVRLSSHANKRVHEFHLDKQDIVNWVLRPDFTYPSRGDIVAVKGDWAVVHSSDKTVITVITVLRHVQERWEHK